MIGKSDILLIKNNYFEITLTLLSIYSFILYPIWLMGPDPFYSGLRLSVATLLTIFILIVGRYIKNKFPHHTLSNVKINKGSHHKSEVIKFVIIMILTLLIHFNHYYNFTLASGGDEASHVSATMNYYYILTFKSTNILLTLPIAAAFILFGLVLAVITNRILGYIDTYSITNKIIIYSIIFTFGAFIFGYIVFLLLTKMGIFIHPYLPSILTRFPPIKQLIGTVALATFGLSDTSLRLTTIIFIPMLIYVGYSIVLDLTEHLSISHDQVFRYMILFTISYLFIFDPILYVFSLMYYQSNGELFFALLTIKYAMRYLKSDSIDNLQLAILAMIVGFLYRRTFIFLILGTVSYMGIIIIWKFYREYKIDKKNISELFQNTYYRIWILIIPFYYILYWMVSLMTAPYTDIDTIPRSDFGRLSLRFGSQFTIYDYPVMIYSIYGMIFTALIILSVLYLLTKSKFKDVKLIYILFVISIWIVGVSIEGSWPSRVDRFIEIIVPILQLILISGILTFLSSIFGEKYNQRKRILRILLAIFLIFIVVNINYTTYNYRKNNYDRFVGEVTYPFEDLSTYLKYNYLNMDVYSPWKGVNPLGFYAFRDSLTQNIYNFPWTNSSNQTLEMLYNFMIIQSFEIIVLPEANSPFVTRDNMVIEKVGDKIHTSNQYFNLVQEFNLNGKYLYVWKINGTVQ